MNYRPRVLIVVDPEIAEGEIHVGGAVVLTGNDAEIGWAVLAKPATVHDDAAGQALEDRLITDGFDVRWLVGSKVVEKPRLPRLP